ncbi:MAG: hypothetical protein CR982_08405 [Candidatus Cloacimonadota bacterium]|nr:MAG: hypothetical protein CR982_08405 [Candidatus Cloacimonadota bacterium]PIE77898.1 MAG: hypothetical protein CSA15_10655 [Candidatus Delongbacteria bacterium]
MVEILQKLQKLQTIEDNLRRVENSKEGLPKLISEMEKEYDLKKEDLSKEENELEELKESLKKNRDTITESHGYLEKYKEQRNQVSNNKEYEAINTEMNYREDLIVDCEKEIETLKQSIEDKEVVVKDKKEVLSGIKSKLDTNRELLAEKVIATEEEENKLNSIKTELLGNIPERYLKIFNKISGFKDGIAVVHGDRGYCGGCRSILPSQKVSELKRKSSIVQCDACSRILTWGFIDRDLLNED